MQDKQQALEDLAAAAGSSKVTFSVEEKRAMREAGKAAQLAADALLAAQVQATDAALQHMSVPNRTQWFKVGVLSTFQSSRQCSLHAVLGCRLLTACAGCVMRQ